MTSKYWTCTKLKLKLIENEIETKVHKISGMFPKSKITYNKKNHWFQVSE